LPAAIFSAADVKILKDTFSLNDTAKILQGTDDPTSVAKDAPQGSLYVRTGGSGGKLFAKQDAGSSTSWTDQSLFANLDVQSVTTTITIASSSNVVLASDSGGSYSITLFAAGTAGKQLFFKKTTSTTNIITIDANGAETIDDALTQTLTKKNEVLALVDDGANWRIVDHYTPAEYVSAEVANTQSSVSADTYIDADSAGAEEITIGPGDFDLGYNANIEVSRVTTGPVFMVGTLVITDSSDTIIAETTSIVGNQLDGTQTFIYAPASRKTRVSLTVATTYKLRIRCNLAAAVAIARCQDNTITGALTDDDNNSILWARRVSE